MRRSSKKSYSFKGVKVNYRIGSDCVLTMDMVTDGGQKVITLFRGKVIDYATKTGEFRVWLYAPYNKFFGLEKVWINGNTTYLSFQDPPNKEEIPNAN